MWNVVCLPISQDPFKISISITLMTYFSLIQDLIVWWIMIIDGIRSERRFGKWGNCDNMAIRAEITHLQRFPFWSSVWSQPSKKHVLHWKGINMHFNTNTFTNLFQLKKNYQVIANQQEDSESVSNLSSRAGIAWWILNELLQSVFINPLSANRRSS